MKLQEYKELIKELLETLQCIEILSIKGYDITNHQYFMLLTEKEELEKKLLNKLQEYKELNKKESK